MLAFVGLNVASAVFVVTGYATGCDSPPGALTKSGKPPVVGLTVAADPSVVPLGSVVYIDGIGERLVHDIGGAVRGRHLDVFMGSCVEARRFGRQQRQVRVLRSAARGAVRRR
ncbi:MAG: 3D domain-containing protein [Betaproteobacteria bacterium]|jgi:3D (Asp-Asp-Asp) domain-containing protein